MTIDGRPAGLDVTTLWTPSTGQAAKRVATWRRRLEGVLKADVIPGWTAVAMEYDPALLTRGEFLDMEAQLDATAATIRSAAQATAPGSKYKVPASDRPRWVTELKVFRAISDRSHVSVTAWAPKRADAVAEAMERIRVKKGAQLAGWGLGIVAIASTTTFDDSGRAEEQLLSRGRLAVLAGVLGQRRRRPPALGSRRPAWMTFRLPGTSCTPPCRRAGSPAGRGTARISGHGSSTPTGRPSARSRASGATSGPLRRPRRPRASANWRGAS